MAKRSIVVNQKQYFLPDHIDTQAYLDYCDVQDALDSATNYRRKHFEQMAQAVCHVYGDQFTLDDVADGICKKLIYRHPHIFGEVQALTPEEVTDIWDAVKMREREAAMGEAAGAEKPDGLLDGVPTSFPALMQAQKISRKAVAVGFEWPDEAGVWAKVAEEIEEFKEAESPEDRELEFGDILFALVNVARWNGVDAENALRATCAKFRRRWSFMEGAAWARGERLEDLSTDEQEELWQQAKAHEREVAKAREA